MPSHNFQQWNPPAANQETDSQYTADALRSGGAAVNAVFSSKLANKLFYQVSTAWAALCQALVNKGYSPNDGSATPASAIANLSAIFSNLMTQADMAPFSLKSSFTNSIGTSGYQKFPGGLILQWVTGTTMGGNDDNEQTLTYPLAFPSACLFALVGTMANNAGISDSFLQVVNFNRISALVINQTAAPGPNTTPGFGAITPMLLVIGN